MNVTELDIYDLEQLFIYELQHIPFNGENYKKSAKFFSKDELIEIIRRAKEFAANMPPVINRFFKFTDNMDYVETDDQTSWLIISMVIVTTIVVREINENTLRGCIINDNAVVLPMMLQMKEDLVREIEHHYGEEEAARLVPIWETNSNLWKHG